MLLFYTRGMRKIEAASAAWRRRRLWLGLEIFFNFLRHPSFDYQSSVRKMISEAEQQLGCTSTEVAVQHGVAAGPNRISQDVHVSVRTSVDWL
jgi:hypothetical protein